jgi:hypothetical protein
MLPKNENYLVYVTASAFFTDRDYAYISNLLNTCTEYNVNINRILIFLLGNEPYKNYVDTIYSNDKRVTVIHIDVPEKIPLILKQFKYVTYIVGEDELGTYIKDHILTSENTHITTNKKTVKVRNYIMPVYKNRTDEYNNTPVKSAIAYHDIKSGNFENFLTNFSIITKANYTLNRKSLKILFDKMQ